MLLSGELGALRTIVSLNKLLNDDDEKLDLILHFGDISYATGYLSEWDEFMHAIRPVAARIPYMVNFPHGPHQYFFFVLMRWGNFLNFGGLLGLMFKSFLVRIF